MTHRPRANIVAPSLALAGGIEDRLRIKRNTAIALAGFTGGLTAALLFYRQPTEPFTAEALHAASQRWRQSGVRAYEVQYRMGGSLYEVECREGIVESLTVDGQVPNVADWHSYSIDGLFELLELELANLTDPAGPFGPQGSGIIARVRFSPDLGYPQRYLRGRAPGAREATLEMLEFRRLE